MYGQIFWLTLNVSFLQDSSGESSRIEWAQWYECQGLVVGQSRYWDYYKKVLARQLWQFWKINIPSLSLPKCLNNWTELLYENEKQNNKVRWRREMKRYSIHYTEGGATKLDWLPTWSNSGLKGPDQAPLCGYMRLNAKISMLINSKWHY